MSIYDHPTIPAPCTTTRRLIHWHFRCDVCGRIRYLKVEECNQEQAFKDEGWIFFTSKKSGIRYPRCPTCACGKPERRR